MLLGHDRRRGGDAAADQVAVFSRFRRDVDEICALLGYYAPSSGNPLPTFRDNVSVPSSRIKKSKKQRGPLKMGPIRCPETSVKDYHSTLRNIPKERRSNQHRGGSLKLRIFMVLFKDRVSKSAYSCIVS